jgi:hypothetical protein
MANDRFVSLTTDELQELLENRDSSNTNKMLSELQNTYFLIIVDPKVLILRNLSNSRRRK